MRVLICTIDFTAADESDKFVEALKKGNDRDAPSFLFESVEPGSNASNGRYSVIGAQPSIEIVAKEDMVTIMDHREGCRTEEIVEDPMPVPRRIMEGWTPQLLDELPEAFSGMISTQITCFKFFCSTHILILSVQSKPLLLKCGSLTKIRLVKLW
ncbi:unnamed protein product [Malus baccata var. baccata]